MTEKLWVRGRETNKRLHLCAEATVSERIKGTGCVSFCGVENTVIELFSVSYNPNSLSERLLRQQTHSARKGTVLPSYEKYMIPMKVET